MAMNMSEKSLTHVKRGFRFVVAVVLWDVVALDVAVEDSELVAEVEIDDVSVDDTDEVCVMDKVVVGVILADNVTVLDTDDVRVVIPLEDTVLVTVAD